MKIKYSIQYNDSENKKAYTNLVEYCKKNKLRINEVILYDYICIIEASNNKLPSIVRDFTKRIIDINYNGEK